MTILTGRGAGPLKSNLVGAGADFVFPSLGGSKLKLDDNPGAEDFTFIFSPSPLAAPAFLAGEYKHELSPEEVRELEEFRSRHGSAQTEVRGEGGERRVVVLAPQQSTPDGRPVIFDLRINHR